MRRPSGSHGRRAETSSPYAGGPVEPRSTNVVRSTTVCGGPSDSPMRRSSSRAAVAPISWTGCATTVSGGRTMVVQGRSSKLTTDTSVGISSRQLTHRVERPQGHRLVRGHDRGRRRRRHQRLRGDPAGVRAVVPRPEDELIGHRQPCLPERGSPAELAQSARHPAVGSQARAGELDRLDGRPWPPRRWPRANGRGARDGGPRCAPRRRCRPRPRRTVARVRRGRTGPPGSHAPGPPAGGRSASDRRVRRACRPPACRGARRLAARSAARSSSVFVRMTSKPAPCAVSRDRPDRLREEGELDVRYHDAEGAGAPGADAAREGVRSVPQSGSGREHSLASACARRPIPAEDACGGRPRHAGLTGDVVEGGVPGPRPWSHGSLQGYLSRIAAGAPGRRRPATCRIPRTGPG